MSCHAAGRGRDAPWRDVGDHAIDGTLVRPVPRTVATVQTDLFMDETLRLARDLCLCAGSFFVTASGNVSSSLSDGMHLEDAERRIAELARTCLSHPAEGGHDFFWNVEDAGEGSDENLEWSLACAVLPVWSGSTWVGLLGVADVWVPDLDQEQRSGLRALGQALGERQRQTAGEARTPDAATASARPGTGAREAGPSDPFLGEVLDNLPDGLIVTRADGTMVLVNQTFSTMTGLEMDEVLGEDVSSVLRSPGAGRSQGAGAQGVGTSGDLSEMATLLGTPEPGCAAVATTESGELRELVASGRRIESRFAGDCFITVVRPPAGLQGARALPVLLPQDGIHALLDHVEDGIVCCDASGLVVLANRAARRLQGLGDTELRVGQPFPAITRLQTLEGHSLDPNAHPLVRSMVEDAPVTADLLLAHDDAVIHVSVSSHPLRVDGGEGAIAVLRDVTVERERQAHLAHYALHDPLTGLANRYLLNDALQRMLDGLSRRGGVVSLIYLDLDRFKEINDEYGHEMGDQVLCAVSQRLLRVVRGEDILARLGGDEFAIAHITADAVSDGDAVVARVRKVLTTPYRFGSVVLDVGASIGWVSTSTGATPDSLIAKADRAMYEHKKRNRAGQGEPAA